MKHFQKIFLQGLVTFLPIAVSIYVAYAGILIVDDFLGKILRLVLKDYYIPGLGFLLSIVLIFLLGLLLNNLITAGLFHSIEKRFTKIPFIKAIYSPLRDLMNLFSQSGENGMKSVVLVNLGSDISVIGLITREKFNDIHALNQNQLEDRVSVYCPFSYALGGYTLLVSRKQLTALDMPVEQAMSLAITGWIRAKAKETEKI